MAVGHRLGRVMTFQCSNCAALGISCVFIHRSIIKLVKGLRIKYKEDCPVIGGALHKAANLPRRSDYTCGFFPFSTLSLNDFVDWAKASPRSPAKKVHSSTRPLLHNCVSFPFLFPFLRRSVVFGFQAHLVLRDHFCFRHSIE